MKKFIITSIAALFGFVIMTSSANAQAVFNSTGGLPTVTISNSTRTVCNYGPIDSCWQTSTSAEAGDVVAVQIYYENSGSVASQGTTLALQSRSISATRSTTIRGGIGSLNGSQVTGSAGLNISSSQSLRYIDGSAKWYPGYGQGTRSVDDSALFNGGFNIGTVNPGEQGVLVAFYQISNNNNNNNNNDECRIDSLTASPSTIDEDEYTTIRWTTTNCTDVELDGDNVSNDGSERFRLNNTKTFELRASNSNNTDRDTVRVTVRDEDEDEYQCDDNRDNDGDGYVDYPNDPGCSSRADNSEYNTTTVVNNTRPQAITTVAQVLSSNSARLNGIAVANANVSTTAWFEWGISNNLGNRTTAQAVNSSNNAYYSDIVSGLNAGTIYYYRAVVQNQNGTAYGEIVRFQTTASSVYVPPTKPTVITKYVKAPTTSTVITKSAASLLELRVDNRYETMCVGGEMEYTVTYRNISGQVLQNAILQVSHPKELTFITSSLGKYEVVDRTVTLAVGDIRPGEQGVVTIRARVNTDAITGNLAVTTATVVYTNTLSHAQEDAIAYSLITVSSDCPMMGAGAVGVGGFFPTTLLGWLLLILVILALIVIVRAIMKKKE